MRKSDKLVKLLPADSARPGMASWLCAELLEPPASRIAERHDGRNRFENVSE